MDGCSEPEREITYDSENPLVMPCLQRVPFCLQLGGPRKAAVCSCGPSSVCVATHPLQGWIANDSRTTKVLLAGYREFVKFRTFADH